MPRRVRHTATFVERLAQEAKNSICRRTASSGQLGPRAAFAASSAGRDGIAHQAEISGAATAEVIRKLASRSEEVRHSIGGRYADAIWKRTRLERRRLQLARLGDCIMPIYRLLQNMPMGPEEISRLTTAYERALLGIGLVDRNDPLAEMVAKKIIEIGQTGVRDPAAISARVIKELGAQ